MESLTINLIGSLVCNRHSDWTLTGRLIQATYHRSGQLRYLFYFCLEPDRDEHADPLHSKTVSPGGHR